MAVTALPKALGAAGEEARFLTEAEIELAYPFLQGLEDYRLVCRPALPEISAYLSGAAAGGQEQALTNMSFGSITVKESFFSGFPAAGLRRIRNFGLMI